MFTISSTSNKGTSTSTTNTKSNKTNGSAVQSKANNGQTGDSLSQLISRSTSGQSPQLSPESSTHSASSNLSHLVRTAPVQAKLVIGSPNDRFEQEADVTAEKVMRSPAPSIQRAGGGEKDEESAQTKPMIQRQEDEKDEPAQTKPIVQMQEDEQEEPAQAKPMVQMQEEEQDESAQTKLMIQAQEEQDEPTQTKPMIQAQEDEEPAQMQEEEEPAQTKIQREAEEKEEVMAKGGNGRVASPGLQARLKSNKGAGQALPESTRSFMEPRFGSDFSKVRVHTGSEAVAMSKELGAQAFTRGNDIFFNEGKFDPNSSQGNKLLAHELTHTIQQGASPAVQTFRAPESVLQRQENGAAEEAIDVEAEIAASEEEATDAIDPGPAMEAQKNAEKENPELEEQIETEKEAVKEKEGELEEKPKKKAAKKSKKRVAKKEEAAPEKKEGEPKGVVGQDLDRESAEVCPKAEAKTEVLAENEQTHDSAKEKLEQTEDAVVPPAEEGQAQSNTEQVESLDDAPAPQPDEEKAKGTLKQEIDRSVPQKIKQLNEFKSKGKAKVVGSKVLGKVKEDTDAVTTTYNEIETAPPARPQEKEPVELPPKEISLRTAELNLGKDAVPPLKEEHTDFSKFDKDSDDLMKKEGISEEQLEMVDEGELMEAKKGRKDLKKNVAEQPGKIKEFAQQETQKVEKDLQEEEGKSRADMRGRRNKRIAQSEEKQKKTKSAMELKRETVTKTINGIYEKAKASVTKKLENLEQASLKAFDRGQEKSSIEFEDEVNTKVSAWKRKRYSGFWGPGKWLKDKWVGIDHFSDIKKIFEDGKAKYIEKIDLLILKITKDNNRVIAECKEELALARKQIKKFVDGLGPALRSTGRKAMADMKAKLNDMDKFIDKKKEEMAQKLCDKKEEAIKKIDEKIEKMKEAMSGLLAKLGNLLLNALIKFFKWALKKAGYDSKKLMGIINKSKAVIKKIITSPVAFIKNIIKAVKTGIGNFVNNIKKHLVAGLISWLTGAMGDAGIQLPQKFDLKGILSLVLQILGLTWAQIRQKLVKRVGEKLVSAIETGVAIVKRVITEGPMALWGMIKEKAAEIKTQVMEGIRNWVITNVVKQGMIKLLSFLNPAGAVVQAILAIYNTIMFFVENWNRIVRFVKTIFGSIADIAMGRLGAAAAAVERSLAMTIPIILSFMARLLGLSGIGTAVKNVIQKIRKPIDRIVNRVIDFIVKKAKKLFGRGKAAVKKGIEKVKALFSVSFAMQGKSHKLQTAEHGGRVRILMSSNHAKPLISQINRALKETDDTTVKSELKGFKTKAQSIEKELNSAPSKKKEQSAKQKLTALSVKIQKYGADHGLSDLLPPQDIEAEGKVGTFGSLRGQKEVTPDHEPQDAVMKKLKIVKFKIGDNRPKKLFPKSTKVAHYSHSKGICLAMHSSRHLETRTFGHKGSGTLNETLTKMGVDKSDMTFKMPQNLKEETAHENARKKVADAVQHALGDDHKIVKKIYRKKKWKLSKKVKERAISATSEVKSRNKQAWTEVF